MLYKEEGIVSTLVAMSSRGEEQALAMQASARRHRPEDLTPREREILEKVWAGFTNRYIAHQLGISIKTVEAHRANMMKKLRVSNTAQLLKTAIETGLLAAGMESR
ncbi:response regulator transcription factor [Nitrospira sp. Nam80]